MDDLAQKASRLSQRAEPYALALVVRCESPTSAKPGARGLITRDGVITGWIGGGCAQPIVVEESLLAMREGTPRLLRITPEAGRVDVQGLRTYEMVCYSGGTMDIFIEPVLPPPRLVILGRSPVARTLARLAKALRYEVIVHAPQATAEDFPDADRLEQGALAPETAAGAYLVVSTQGEDDEGAVEAAARSEAGYVAFVASKKKWQAVSSVLKQRGVAPERLARVQAPAGVEIHALEPEEIALSVMAQIVSVRRSQQDGAALSAHDKTHAQPAATGKTSSGHSSTGKAEDPICHMQVDIASAKHTAQYQGRTFYFCCAGCQQRFEQNPAAHSAASA